MGNDADGFHVVQILLRPLEFPNSLRKFKMKVPTLLSRVLPTLNLAQQCPACGETFACEINLGGCWCSEVKLSPETLQELRAKYNGCLCRACLESAEARESRFP